MSRVCGWALREIIRKNTDWDYTHGDLIFPSRVATPDGVDKVFSQLGEADIPVLIEIIRKHDQRYSAEYQTAKWALQKFGSRALPIISSVVDLYPSSELAFELVDIRNKIKGF